MSLKKLLIQLAGLKAAYDAGLISAGTWHGLESELITLYIGAQK
jgi:hypothetical protein